MTEHEFLIDGNNLLMGSIMGIFRHDIEESAKNENVIRDHPNYGVCLRQILATVEQMMDRFDAKWGNSRVVFVYDSRTNHRFDTFSFYKKARQTRKKNDPAVWNFIHRVANSLREDLYLNFPIWDCESEGFEADDTIARLCFESMTYLYGKNSVSMIVASGDRDLLQLLPFASIYNIRTHEHMAKGSDPIIWNYDFLEHIIKGDASDGVPCILSEDDTLVALGKRNKRITSKLLSEIKADITPIFFDSGFTLDFDSHKNLYVKYPYLRRNRAMIDLGYISATQQIRPKTKWGYLSMPRTGIGHMIKLYDLNQMLDHKLWVEAVNREIKEMQQKC